MPKPIPFHVICSILCTLLLSSCMPDKAHDGALSFEVITLPAPIGTTAPVSTPPTAEPNTYEKFKAELFDKSCVGCHRADQSNRAPEERIPSFASKEDVMDHSQDIILYLEEGCSMGKCMPPRRRNGEPVKPIPSAELIAAFKKWKQAGFL